ncbi:hypothetical protein CSUB01_09537 [Colletotrichum sublineola]|uniref:Uncharacterized protein n=1 Tax=Colletotrichum sublineola TaxID=1173701 RepID=A0A066XB62_COLSU|nr:hypothetical protein CSUB01_09537 [Colletotrichum sublineola]
MYFAADVRKRQEGQGVSSGWETLRVGGRSENTQGIYSSLNQPSLRRKRGDDKGSEGLGNLIYSNERRRPRRNIETKVAAKTPEIRATPMTQTSAARVGDNDSSAS